MKKKYLEKSKNNFSWPISKKLLGAIISDQVTDLFLCELVWERLFYVKNIASNDWISSQDTPNYWSDKFFNAPKIISERPASVHLTRSIPKDNKQGLKNILNFSGYKINDLYPRRTRRAVAANWLIYKEIELNFVIKDEDVMPRLFPKPFSPAVGHKGDPEIK